MTWQRLESASVTADLAEGQEARIADALWLLGRQWQVGELTGDDASHPLLVEADMEFAPITRFQPGASEDAGPILEVDGVHVPLEVAVERMPVRSSVAGARIAAEAGLHLFRLLDHHGADGGLRQHLRKAWPLALPADDGLDAVGWAELRLLTRRSFDARAFRRDDPDPGSFGGAAADAIEQWTSWYDTVFSEPDPDAPESWSAERLDHRFRLSAHPDGGEVVLDAPEYRGGHLDWYAFDVRDDVKLQAPPSARTRRVTAIPTRATFAGQAATRWWEFEDVDSWFGDVQSAPEDLARVAVAAFGATFGEDWFLLPVRLPVGHLARVRRLRVLDSFGRGHRIRSTAALDGPERSWRFMELTGDRSADAPDRNDRANPWLLLAPAMTGVVEGPPLEVVVLTRDEVANVGWAAEERLESVAGRVVDHVAGARARRTPRSPSPDPAWEYLLSTEAPDHLLPLLPVHVEDEGGLYLQRGRIAVGTDDDGGVVTRGARGVLLEPDRQLLVLDAAVPRSGVEVRRAWQHARTRSGGVVAWIGRRTGPPRPRPVPETTFDAIDRRQA